VNTFVFIVTVSDYVDIYCAFFSSFMIFKYILVKYATFSMFINNKTLK
jgi:hypothetical protein